MASYSYSLEEIRQAAKFLIEECKEEKVWVFQGEMGAGKTTLIKAIASEFEVTDPVSSPTFGLVNHYEINKKEVIYHFDFYRIEDPMEALDIGIEEYFYSGNYCWIEWAERIAGFLPEQFFLIKIELESRNQRLLHTQHVQNAS